MAYSCPKDLDGFMPHLAKADTRFRQQVGSDLLAFLNDPCNSIICQDIGQFVDGLIPWMQSSNYKVSSNGIEVMTCLIDRLGHDFRPYLQTVFPAVIDRLGDAKDTVREKAQLLILKLLERNVLTPQTLLEKLMPGFAHKNAKIREEVLRCLVNTINEHGSQSVTLSKLIPHIVKLLSDPTATVRDTAYATLIDLYKHVGEKLRIDLQRRNLVPAAKLPQLLARFDEVKAAGELLPTASTGFEFQIDEVDRIAMPKPALPVKKVGLVGGAVKKGLSASSKGSVTTMSSNSAPVSRAGSMRKPTSAAGGVDEETLINSFEDVPTVQIFSARELAEHMKGIQETISDANKDWNKRVDALKKVRSLIIAGATTFEDFLSQVRSLEIPLQVSIKDLRSQVVREACITIAYLSQTFGSRFDHSSEFLLNALVNLIQNSAKVVATAGHITVRFILQHTQSPRLIPIITNNLAMSKSKDIRRSCCEFLEQILTTWSTHTLERHIGLLQEALRKGISDADPEARVSSRKAFRGFKEHFPTQSEVLLQSLDPSYRRALQGELCLSSSSSSSSLVQTSGLRTPRQYRAPTTPQSASGSTENLYSGYLQRTPSLPRSHRQRSGIPILSRDNSRKAFRKSNSAIDLQAAQRAKARAQYSAMARQKVAYGTASLQGEVAQQARPKRSPEVTSVQQSPERVGRTRSRSSGVFHSQPTSRSGSPNSRIPYMYRGGTLDHDSPRPRRLSSGIPRSNTCSRDTSREASPTRSATHQRIRQRTNDRPPLSPASRPVMAQKILQQSREAESALADALYDQDLRLHSRKGMRSLDNHSDDSETSSVCSERSFDSYRRQSDDINEIVSLCASTVWQERKEGLVSLQHYLNSGALLTPAELKHITDIFTRMFMDSHTKGLRVFLDTLTEVVKRHKNDLHDWLYVLLQRIFHKLGTDLLTSNHSKLLSILEVIKKSFPVQLQFQSVYRFLIDATQTPNTKVKVVVLTFLSNLCHICDPSEFVSNGHANQALLKIINYAQDMKSAEIRQAAKHAIVALWNCNTPQVTMMLAELPKEYQDVASSIVHNHLKKSSSDGDSNNSAASGSPKTLSPTTPTARNDEFNQEEIYRSLRKTTAEIQNYSYEGLGLKLDRDRDTTSQDSGISQMSLGNMKSDVTAIEEQMEELTLRQSYTAPRSGPRSLPYTVNGLTETDSNGYGSVDSASCEEVVNKVLELCLVDNPTPMSEKQKYLSQLCNAIKNDQIEPVVQNFRKLLRLLLDNLESNDATTQIKVLQVFIEIFKNKQMAHCWSDFVELLTLRVLSAHVSEKRDVVKVAEQTAAAMCVFPFDAVVSVLSPIIQTSDCPAIQGAIKMLTKLVEVHPNSVTDVHLADVMPGLIKANDHAESSVRKSAVFCMVALHKAVGEERLAPHIASLAGSKLKLLRLYIGRSQTNSSVPTSPKNQGHASTTS